MLISDLVATLQAIYNEFGDMDVELHYDVRQSEGIIKDSQGISIDTIKTVKMKPENKGVYLTNDFFFIDNYNGCRCEVSYNPEKKVYEGKLIPQEKIEGFNTTFVSPDKYEIQNIFKAAVDEYNDFLGNAKISKTYEKVSGILENNNEEDVEDYDYGELTGPNPGDQSSNNDEYASSDDDDDYGET